MKNIPVVTLLTSLVIGAFLVVFFATQTIWWTEAQSSWQTNEACQVAGSTANVERCSVLEYGYPYRFIASEVRVNLANEAVAVIEVNKKALFFNWAVLSGAVAAGIVLATSLIGTKTKSKQSKRKK